MNPGQPHPLRRLPAEQENPDIQYKGRNNIGLLQLKQAGSQTGVLSRPQHVIPGFQDPEGALKGLLFRQQPGGHILPAKADFLPAEAEQDDVLIQHCQYAVDIPLFKIQPLQLLRKAAGALFQIHPFTPCPSGRRLPPSWFR